MNLIKLTVFGLIFITIFSCKRENKNIENTLLGIVGREINLIDSLKYYSKKNGFYNDSPKTDLKVVTYIDGGCGSCVFELNEWKEFLSSPKLKNVSCLFFVKSYDKKQIALILDEADFSYPVIIDLTNKFYEVNEINADKNYQTFLVNKDNEIVLVGNPTYNSQIKKLYFETISELNKDKVH